MPEQLQAYPHFVVWTYHEVGRRLTKPPIDPKTGRFASPSDPQTWGSATQAMNALKTGRFEGIGFVFTSSDPFIGTDLGHCLRQDGTMEPWAQEIVAALNSYTEYSPSRAGLHILTQARLPEGGRRRENTEIYDAGRYFTLTGNHLKGTLHTIEQRQTEQMQVYQRLAPREHATPPPVFSQSQADSDVLEKAQRARNGQGFTALYRGDIGGFRSKLVFDSLYIADKKERGEFKKRSRRDEKKPTPHAKNAQPECLSIRSNLRAMGAIGTAGPSAFS